MAEHITKGSTEKILVRILSAITLICAVIVVMLPCGSAFNMGAYYGGAADADDTDLQTKPALTEPVHEQDDPKDDKPIQPPERVDIILDGKGEVPYNTLYNYVKENPGLGKLSSPETTISAAEYVSLCEMNPSAEITVKVDYQGIVIDPALDEVDFSENIIADKALFAKVLDRFPKKMKFVMCDCGYTNEEMGALRETYPGHEFAWRIYMGEWDLRTDDEAFSVMIVDDDHVRLKSEDIEVLRYCTNLYALDLGHQELTDLTVIGELTDLRVLILADNLITDVSPLANLKNLQYLELFVNRISDLTPIAECTELVDLNFGWNAIFDISCIYSLEKIERLWLPHTYIYTGRWDEVKAEFPGAQIVFEDKDSISSGWRTHERYFLMRGMFNMNKYNPDFVK